MPHRGVRFAFTPSFHFDEEILQRPKGFLVKLIRELGNHFVQALATQLAEGLRSKTSDVVEDELGVSIAGGHPILPGGQSPRNKNSGGKKKKQEPCGPGFRGRHCLSFMENLLKSNSATLVYNFEIVKSIASRIITLPSLFDER